MKKLIIVCTILFIVFAVISLLFYWFGGPVSESNTVLIFNAFEIPVNIYQWVVTGTFTVAMALGLFTAIMIKSEDEK